MKTLDHPNIVKLKEVFIETREVHMVMELCSGGDLAKYIKNHSGKLPELQVARLLASMISCIVYLHEKGIVHRDLKLENFLFESTAKDAPIKLIDFGLSKHLDEGEYMARIAGTPYYVAPEVWNGRYDNRCDIWSLGVCAYLLVYKSVPFNGSDVDDVRRKIQERDPAYSSDRFASSTLAEAFVRELLRKDPVERIALADALAHPFIRAGLSADSSAPSDSALSLLKYLNMNETKKLLLKTVAFCLSTEQIARLRQGFDEMDKDKNGVISMQELRQSLEQNSSHTKAELDAVFSDIDFDPEAVINYSEFLAAAMHKHLLVEKERLELAFKKLDKGSSHCVM